MIFFFFLIWKQVNLVDGEENQVGNHNIKVSKSNYLNK